MASLPRPRQHPYFALYRRIEPCWQESTLDSKLTTPARVLVIDDHPFLLEGIHALIARGMNAEVVGNGMTGEAAVRLARELSPDVILMDVSMQGISGIEATRRVLADNADMAVIMLTMHDSVEYVHEARLAGARGYVLKSSNPLLIQQAIEICVAGGMFYDPAVARVLDGADGAVSPAAAGLTARERQVLALLAEGCLNKEIADHLCLSVRTVETYRERLMRKLDMRNVAELTRFAVAQNIVPLR